MTSEEISFIMNIVHDERRNEVNPKITSKEEILSTCRRIVSKESLNALSMRHVAEVQNIALGSLYHYFSSKEEMITAVVESVWLDIFHLQEDHFFASFPAYVTWLEQCVKDSKKEYPNFSMAHSMSFASSAKPEAKAAMMHCFAQLKQGMAQALDADYKIRKDAFDNKFTKNEFVDFVFSSFYVSLLQSTDNKQTLLQVIDRCIY